MRYISLFSGIEAATVAFQPLNFEPVAFAEIDPFCCALLQHHYPEVPNLGDVTKADWGKYRGIDLVVGGSPCQSFSIAGSRRSLADERGNLTLEYIRAIHEIDPAYCIWENVPGILSTPDNAFGCFLAGLVGADSPLVPPRELKSAWRGERIKWSNAGLVAGPKRVAAWRILNSEFFGVAQRRRRVFVLSCRTGDERSAQILFESTGNSGIPAPCCETGQDPATATGERPESIIAFSHKDSGGDIGSVCPTLRSLNFKHSHINGGGQVAIAFRTANTTSNGWGVAQDVAHTLDRAQGQAVCHSHDAAIVRRLTPLEAERLQGFPDFYTAIPYRGKPASDSQRYRAIGNSMAVPVIHYLGSLLCRPLGSFGGDSS